MRCPGGPPFASYFRRARYARVSLTRWRQVISHWFVTVVRAEIDKRVKRSVARPIRMRSGLLNVLGAVTTVLRNVGSIARPIDHATKAVSKEYEVK